MVGIGLCLPQLGEHVTPGCVRAFAQRAEALGYSSLWVQDHFLWPLEPRRGYGGRAGAPVPPQYRSVWAPTELLAAVTAWTSRITVGTSVLVGGNHWPGPLAQRLATIDVLSGGRLVVGLSVGWNAEEHDASGSDIRTRGARLEEMVSALKACWGPDPVSHAGRFFTIPPAIMRPKPVQRPHPPLLSGMWSEAGLDRTRRLFDGWNPSGRPVDQVATTVARLNTRRPEGMAPLSVYFRAFAQFPVQPTQPFDVVDRLVDEVRAAKTSGFTEYIVEHNFWAEIRSADDWARVPDRFAPLLDAAV